LAFLPALWRTVVNDILRAVSQEYRDRLGDMRGSQEFESFRAAFTVIARSTSSRRFSASSVKAASDR